VQVDAGAVTITVDNHDLSARWREMDIRGLGIRLKVGEELAGGDLPQLDPATAGRNGRAVGAERSGIEGFALGIICCADGLDRWQSPG